MNKEENKKKKDFAEKQETRKKELKDFAQARIIYWSKYAPSEELYKKHIVNIT